MVSERNLVENRKPHISKQPNDESDQLFIILQEFEKQESKHHPCTPNDKNSRDESCTRVNLWRSGGDAVYGSLRHAPHVSQHLSPAFESYVRKQITNRFAWKNKYFIYKRLFCEKMQRISYSSSCVVKPVYQYDQLPTTQEPFNSSFLPKSKTINQNACNGSFFEKMCY